MLSIFFMCFWPFVYFWESVYSDPLPIFYNFIYLCLAVLGLHCSTSFSQAAVSRATLQLQWSYFSLRWLVLLQSTGSRCMGFCSYGSWALEPRLNLCGAQPSLLHGMWVLPGPGIEPVSPALAGRFLSTRLLGKSLNWFLLCAEPTLHCNKYIRVCVQDTIEGVVGPLQKQKIQSLCQVASISL